MFFLSRLSSRALVLTGWMALWTLGCGGGGGGDTPAGSGGGGTPPPAPLPTVIYGITTGSIPTRYDLHLVKADGTGHVQLTTTGDATNALAIEGSRVIYTRWLRSHRHLYSVGTNGAANVSLGSDTADVDQLWIGNLNGRVIYSIFNSAEGANASDIYSINPDGSDLRQIASYAYTSGVQAITPLILNGKVVYTDISGGSGDLYAMNADGTGLTTLAAGATLESIQGEANPLDPITGKVVYEVSSGTNVQFHAIKVDGTAETTLAPGFQKQLVAKVSGGQLFYLLNTSGSLYDLWAVALDGSNNRRLAAGGSRYLYLNDVSSTQAFYTSYTTGTGAISEVYAVRWDGIGPTALSPLSQRYGLAGLAGNKVVLTSTLGPGLNRLYVVNTDGTGLTPLTPGTEIAYFLGYWNSRIYFSRNLGTAGSVQYAIFSCATDGTGITPIVSNPGYSVSELSLHSDRFIFQRLETTVSSPTGVGSVRGDGTGELLLSPATATLLLAQ